MGRVRRRALAGVIAVAAVGALYVVRHAQVVVPSPSSPGAKLAWDPPSMTDRVHNDLAALQQVRIFFGHQSVGADMLAGLADLQRDADRPIRVVVLTPETPMPVPPGVLLHTTVGRNQQPRTKCDDFRRILDERLPDAVDIALLKFCYIDIDEQSNVGELFAYYRSVMDALARRQAGITFVHVTAPLRHTPGGWGVWIRETLGRPNRAKLANIRRNEFNELLRRTYAGAPVFDLAASQSTYPDGRREGFAQGGRTYESLIGAFTSDGGHLNEVGRAKVAADLIHALARVAASRRQARAAAAAGRY